MPKYTIEFDDSEYEDFMATCSSRSRNIDLESAHADIDNLAKSAIDHCDSVEALKDVLEQIRKHCRDVN